MPKGRKAYPSEFKQQMVELVRAGRSPEELAKEFEPSAHSIRTWVKQADLDTGRRTDGMTTAEQEELRRLRKENNLKEAGQRVAAKRVGRLMKEAGIEGVSRRKKAFTTRRDADASPVADLVARQFASERPDELWVADITYVPAWSGFLYLAVVMDAWSRRIVGWSMATHLRTELVLGALDMALAQRRPEAVIHHSDHGCQYTSYAFGHRCREAGVVPSMGSVGDCYDNALCESFFATLECELLDRRSFETQAEARAAVFHFIEGWYNPHRRHSALGQLSPAEFEKRAAAA
jgi:putative transposase